MITLVTNVLMFSVHTANAVIATDKAAQKARLEDVIPPLNT
jgi:hypothetical protein